LTIRFIDVEKFTTLTPLSLLISNKPAFLIVNMGISFPTFALKYPNKIFMLHFMN